MTILYHYEDLSVNYLQVLAGAKIPLLHIKGENDRSINNALGSTLRVLEGMENAEIIEMPGVGHLKFPISYYISASDGRWFAVRIMPWVTRF